MFPSCSASMSRPAEQAFDCLLSCIDNSYCHHLSLLKVIFYSESEISLHKITSHAGVKPLLASANRGAEQTFAFIAEIRIDNSYLPPFTAETEISLKYLAERCYMQIIRSGSASTQITQRGKLEGWAPRDQESLHFICLRAAATKLRTNKAIRIY